MTLYHECRSDKWRGGIAEVPRHQRLTPYMGKVSPEGIPVILPKPEPPQHFENYHCDECGFHVMKLVPSASPGQGQSDD